MTNKYWENIHKLTDKMGKILKSSRIEQGLTTRGLAKKIHAESNLSESYIYQHFVVNFEHGFRIYQTVFDRKHKKVFDLYLKHLPHERLPEIYKLVNEIIENKKNILEDMKYKI